MEAGDPKESFYIGPLTDTTSVHLNQWPSEELLPNWRPTMESLFWKILSAGKELLSLIALSLNLDENYFEKISALNKPEAFLRLLRYPGELGSSEEICGASPHSDYGMITLLMTNGVPGLQICKEKLKQPQVWEDVSHVEGAIIVNIGDMMERWTNCVYQSTLHRVMPTGKERYSVAFFMDPPSDCVVECFESCCSESSPPRHAWIDLGSMRFIVESLHASNTDMTLFEMSFLMFLGGQETPMNFLTDPQPLGGKIYIEAKRCSSVLVDDPQSCFKQSGQP
ncbi:flavonol synthase/flavanone 3-hydroxylase [Trifolium pratense]|uniref:Flavonol synthase/flavanone 3-hydroxylase n=1 Tax=Trifolium pratense TaxID=57577 RepID=A0A2K3N1Q1_TRIPR|nr:flavonol synthase/flavanone 3-hydroxylase [Trifolium pratense]